MASPMQKDVLLDHDADGIQEFDNSLPRWWLYGFYFTVVFSVVYMVYYHISNDGSVMENEYAAEMKAAAALGDNATGDVKKPAAQLSDRASLAAGQAIFEGNTFICHTCHRNDLGGAVGPNLTDDHWLHGCGLDSVMYSIATGYPDKGMLPYGSGAKMTDEQLLQVASYIISKKGSNPPEPKPTDPERDVVCGAVAQ